MGGAGIKFDTYLTLLMSLSCQLICERIMFRHAFFSLAFLPGITIAYVSSGGSQVALELDACPSNLIIGPCAGDPCAGGSCGLITSPAGGSSFVSGEGDLVRARRRLVVLDEVDELASLRLDGGLERVRRTCASGPCAGVCPCAGVGVGGGGSGVAGTCGVRGGSGSEGGSRSGGGGGGSGNM